jgi:hypothetical protein
MPHDYQGCQRNIVVSEKVYVGAGTRALLQGVLVALDYQVQLTFQIVCVHPIHV